jgi:RNA polymerase sigma-70 factor (ECF subfamily)
MPDRTVIKGTREDQEREARDLLSRVKRGDRCAFSRLYKQYHPRLYGYLKRLLSNPALVEEVLDVSTWIFGIAYRKALTAIRSDHRYQSGLDRQTDTDALAGESRQHREWIQAGLLNLSPDHRQVLELTYYGGFSYQEIAEIAGCPVNTVKTRMFHARRRLKILLPALAGQTGEQFRERS